MKKTIAMLLSLLALGASAQEKGRFEVHDFDQFKLHIYYTQDVMNDASFIIEGKEALVTLEEPLFKENVSAFNAYLNKLNKPIEKRISDYHLGGTGDHPIVMPEGMPTFINQGQYAEMMKGFSKNFGEAIVSVPTGNKEEVNFGSTPTYAGISFAFQKGLATDFPAANLLIGGKVWYAHWAPAKAHLGRLQIKSAAAIDTLIAFLEEALRSRATLFIGGHGQATSVETVRFQIDYLKKMKATLGQAKSDEAFVTAMKQAYPDLPGEKDLEGVAKALYQ